MLRSNPAVGPGGPYLYETLSIYLQLESLVPDDKARLAKAMALVGSWIGPRLRWTLNSRVGEHEPYRPFDLAYVPALCDDLSAPPLPPDEACDPWLAAMRVEELAEYGLSCHGGAAPFEASPWSLRFWTDPLRLHFGGIVDMAAAIRISVPLDTPLDELEARTVELCETLRVRWGAAGLSFSGEEIQSYEVTRGEIYARARRFPGFDVGLYVANMRELHERIRSVSWLTVVGKSLAQRLGEAPSGAPCSDELVEVRPVGDGLVIKAGAAPARGDVNRLDWPAAYRRADRWVQPVRLARDVSFFGKWDEASTEKWLRRFELQSS